MRLSGAESGRWEVLGEDEARRLEVGPSGGVGALGDQRADGGQYLERRLDGGAWTTFSYWPGAIDFWVRSRLTAVETLENDRRLVSNRAQGILDAAGAGVQAARNRIAQGEVDLKAALESEKQDKAIARDLQKQAEAVEAQIKPLRRELDGVPPAPVASAEAVEAATA